MRRPSFSRHAALWAVAVVVTAGVWTLPSSGGAGAVSGALAGEGGDAVGPIVQKLLRDDASGLAPDTATYTGTVDLDQGIADFVGSAPNTFATDFAVTERPLTSAEASTAKANGRSYAYVPFAATPIALMTLVPVATWSGTTINQAQFCQHIPLDLTQLDDIYSSQAAGNWSQFGISCSTPPSAPMPADGLSFIRSGNLDPTMENFNFMSLLDSTAASQTAFGTAFSTSDEAPSEHWPYSGTGVTGGDQATLGSVIGLDPETNAPSTQPSTLVAGGIKLGAIMPVAADWTGDPLGVAWNLPTAAIQNASSNYVTPTETAAQDAEDDSTLAATKDPTTNNLVTFNATGSDAADAYNNYLMMESYLLVPTNGLTADQAQALAQLVRFVAGGTGQADIKALGAAPVTTAMQTADLAVAQTLDAEAAAAPASTTTSTTGASGSGSSSTTSTSSTVVSLAAGTGNTGSGTSASTDPSSTSGLADTGSDPGPIVVLGLAFLVVGEAARRFFRRRRSRA